MRVERQSDQPAPPGLPRRLAAVVYDGLLLFAVLFAATALVLPFAGGSAIAPANPLYLLYLLGVSYLYFAWFWTHGGQTLGMRAWRFRVLTQAGEALTWRRAGLRFGCALLSWGALGAGFLWTAFDREQCSWHDRLSGTRTASTTHAPDSRPSRDSSQHPDPGREKRQRR